MIKNVIKDIKEKDTHNTIKHFIKDKAIHDKTNTLKKRKYEEKEIDERDYPIQKIEETQRTVAIESYSRTKRSVKEKKKTTKTIQVKRTPINSS